ncbi:GATS protein-like 3 [Balamuthia mandrillaris]
MKRSPSELSFYQHAKSNFTTTITPLPYELYLCSFRTKDISQCAYTLIQLMLFPQQQTFFSFTSAQGEASMVIEKKAFELFPPDIFIRSKYSWKAIQIGLGSLGYTGTGVVSSVSRPLACSGIPIYYLSTANSDFILVQESTLDQAMACLGSAFCAGEESIGTPLPSRPPRLTTLPAISLLASFNQQDALYTTKPLLGAIFYNDRVLPANQFFSFAQVDEETSLLIDEESAKLFQVSPGSCIAFSEPWCCFQRKKKHGFSETGVVSYLSSILARAEIPMLYLSTYGSDLILVEQKSCKNATDLLTEAKILLEGPLMPTEDATHSGSELSSPPYDSEDEVFCSPSFSSSSCSSLQTSPAAHSSSSPSLLSTSLAVQEHKEAIG